MRAMPSGQVAIGLAARAAAAALMAAAVDPSQVSSWIIWVAIGVAWARMLARVAGPSLVRMDAGSLWSAGRFSDWCSVGCLGCGLGLMPVLFGFVRGSVPERRVQPLLIVT